MDDGMSAGGGSPIFFLVLGATVGVVSTILALITFFIGRAEKTNSAIKAVEVKADAAVKAAEIKADTAIAAVAREAKLEIEKCIAIESKARHDLGNSMQMAVGRLEERMDRLGRETVRKEDMGHLEQRMTASQDKIEQRMDTRFDRIEQLLDGLANRNPLIGPIHNRG